MPAEGTVGPSVRVGVAVLILGIAIALPPAVVLGVRTGPTILRTLNSPSIRTPGVAQRRFTAGTWFLYERTGTKRGGGGFTVTRNEAPVLRPADVTVTEAGGGTLAVSQVTVNETLTKGSRIYTAVLQFKVLSAGTYTVTARGPDSEVIVGRSLGDTFRGSLGLFLIGGIGGLLIAAGVVLLIVGAVRRNRRAARP